MTIPKKACKIEGCVSATRIKSGYCGKHYQNYKKHGDPLYAEKRRLAQPKNCKVLGCMRAGSLKQNGVRYFHNGYCEAHYLRLRRTGGLNRRTKVLSAKANHSLTNTWHGMMRRCYLPTHKSYANYGGRGIKVCDRWHVFDNFVIDLKAKPFGRTLDRIDNDGDYAPENVRWASPRQQASNRSNNVALTIAGRTKTVSQWSASSPVTASTIYRRIKRGYSLANAVYAPAERKRKAP